MAKESAWSEMLGTTSPTTPPVGHKGPARPTTSIHGFLKARLANNGGPTLTIALRAVSLAIDAIPVADCTDQSSPQPKPIIVDQRGFPRPDAGEAVYDVGAYESES
jgi:hypothetical protein